MEIGWLALIATIIGIIGTISTLLINSLDVREKLKKRGIVVSSAKFTKWKRVHRKHLNQYFAHELQELLGSNTPGSTQLKVRDLIESEDVFIPPGWCPYPPGEAEPVGQGQYSADEKLQDHLIAKVLAGERVLLLGDPGQGKSTLLKRVYYELARRFRDKSSPVVPLYIPCRDLNIDQEAGRRLEGLYRYLHTRNNPLLLSEQEFRAAVKNRLLVMLFDGFDEIRGELNQDAINQRVNSDIFLNPGVLSCRTHFYEFHLSCSPLDINFPNKICLLPLEQKDIESYIARVCARQKKDSLFGTLAQEIRRDNKLGDLSKRLLLLVMITDIYTAGVEFKRGQWNTAKLYDEYTRSWLKNEASKSKLGWRDKSELLEQVAWEIFTAKLPSTLAYGDTQKVTISQSEISSLFARLDAPRRYNRQLAEVVEDICSQSCLGTSGETYHFTHRSFHEYFVARHVIRSIQADRERALDALNQGLPVEIATFLKDMLQLATLEPARVEIITKNLTEVYKGALGKDSREALITREQAGYYLSRLKTDRVARFLEAAIRDEPDKWVRRGMIIGLVYKFQRCDVLEAYIENLYTDREADSINLGYHLEYYGDQPPDGDHKYNSYPRCDRTVRALMRHLETPEEHRIGWALDILTLRRFLCEAGRERSILSDENVQFLREFLRSTPEGDRVFEVERRALINQLEEQNLI